MEVRATAKYVRVQPRKVRVVAAEVKGSPAEMSVHKLRFHPSKSATVLRKVLMSAIANAQENHGLSSDSLRIKLIRIDDGPVMKRMDAKAMGRGARIRKKTAHITVVVEDYTPEVEAKPTVKVKPRPKFEVAKPKKAAAKKEAAEAPAEEEVKEETVEAVAEEAAAPAEATEETVAEVSAEAQEEGK